MKRRDRGGDRRSDTTNESARLSEQEKDHVAKYIEDVAKTVMNAMDKHMTEHIGHADPNVGANASALALAYCLAMNAPSDAEIDIFMLNATEQAKDVAKETKPIVMAQRLSSHGRPTERERAERGVEQFINAMSKKSTVH